MEFERSGRVHGLNGTHEVVAQGADVPCATVMTINSIKDCAVRTALMIESESFEELTCQPLADNR